MTYYPLRVTGNVHADGTLAHSEHGPNLQVSGLRPARSETQAGRNSPFQHATRPHTFQRGGRRGAGPPATPRRNTYWAANN
uniref:Uncharacterized protein n=1 Tax=Arundo donax TaxID=35708 RepID=A0A0A8ZAA7_ARUDO